MKKHALWVAVAVLTLSAAIGLGRDVHSIAKGGSSCPPPVTKLLDIDSAAARLAVDKWAAVKAADFQHPGSVGWGVAVTFKFSPAEIVTVVAIGDGFDPTYRIFTAKTPKFYRLDLVRDCAGGDWRVVSARPIRLHLDPARPGNELQRTLRLAVQEKAREAAAAAKAHK